MTNGTPKNLLGAISNGLEDSKSRSQSEFVHEETVKEHVLDFLAQKFGAAMLKNPDAELVLKALHDKIKE